MNKKLTFFTSVLSVCIFFSGCFAGLDRYQPKSAAEEAVIKVVMEHERTWNENDASGFLKTFHASAKQVLKSNSGAMGSCYRKMSLQPIFFS